MKESSKTQTVVVGLFVTFAAAILVGGILMIGDLNDTFTRKMVVTTVFDNVGGLKVGDSVWLSGVRVGNVKRLALHEGGDVKVELKLDTEAAPFLPADTQAKISSDGLIGSRIVVLFGGTPGGDPLKDGAVLTAGVSVSTDDMLAMLQENNENIKVITGKLARGEGTVGKLLQDEGLYNDVTAAVASLNATSESARGATDSLSVFAAKLNQPGRLPNDIVTDRTTWPRVTGAVGSVELASQRASDTVASVSASLADTKTPVGAALHDEVAAADLKKTLANLRTGTALMNDDLTALQDNFLLRAPFKRAAKAKAKAEKAAAKAEAKRLRDAQ